MAWKNRLQLERTYTDPAFRRSFARLYGLRELLGNCIVPPDYSPREMYADGIRLTARGEEWEKKLAARYPHLPRTSLVLSLFVAFSHQDMFIDVVSTDDTALRHALHDDMTHGLVRYPWPYDRLLYNRFFEMYPSRTSGLSYEETVRLLDGTPQGFSRFKK